MIFIGVFICIELLFLSLDLSNIHKALKDIEDVLRNKETK